MKTPYFLWDYKLDDKQIHAIIHGANETEKLWIIGRILTHAKFEDVWNYLTINDILKAFPNLRLPPVTKQAWQKALAVWGYHVETA